MKVFGFNVHVSRATAYAAVDTTRTGWRERLGDMIQAARGRAGMRPGERLTNEHMSEYYGLLPKLSMLQIRGLAMDWMAGNWSAAYDLVSLMLDTWPVALKNQHECRSTLRRITYLAMPYRVGSQEPSRQAVAKAAFINECLESFRPTAGTDERGWSGTVYGLAGALVMPTIREVLWTQDGGDWRPYATAWAHPKTYGRCEETLDDGRVVTRLAARVGDRRGITMLGYNAGAEAIWLPIDRTLVGIYDTRDGACTMSGLVRPLMWWWGGMMYGRDWLLRYAEMFGQPLRVGYYSRDIKTDDLAALKTMLGTMGASAWAALPEEVRKLDFYEGKGVSADNPQRFMIEHGDKYCDLLFKGETSQGGNYSGGQREQADFRQSTRTARDESYADWASEIIREQLAREIVRRNWGTDDEVPFVLPDYTEEPDKLEQAQVVDTWLKNYDMDPDDAAEISGLPLVVKEARAVAELDAGVDPMKGATTVATKDRETEKVRARAVAEDNYGEAERRRIHALAEALSADPGPVVRRLEKIDAQTDPADALAELRELSADLPRLLRRINADPDAARELEKAIVSELGRRIYAGGK